MTSRSTLAVLSACLLAGSACALRIGDGPTTRTGELKREARSVSRATAAKAERVAAEIHMGAGENKIDLSTLDIRSAEIHLGAGRVDLDLRGLPGHDREVSLNGGVGEARIRVTRDANAVATAKGGLGEILAE